MAEQLAGLLKSEPKIQTFEFNVSNVSVSVEWGNIYLSARYDYDTGINLANKKIFCWFVQSDTSSVWICSTQINDNTEIKIIYARGTSGTINGKLYVMVTD